MSASVKKPGKPPIDYRGLTIQGVVLTLFVALVGYFVVNTATNLNKQGIASGFGFLDTSAGFGIIQSLIDYDESSSYGRAFLVGLLNTLLVSGLGIIAATLIGFFVGVARLSKNWLVAKLASFYIEMMRNIPLLLHIFFWYFVVLRALPHPRQSLSYLDSIFINNRGIYFPAPILQSGSMIVFLAFVAGCVAAIALSRWARGYQDRTGRTVHSGLIGWGMVLGVPLLTYFAVGRPVDLEYPELRGFNFAGGTVVIPELASLFAALSIYTGAFIAEIVRSGILSVDKGQIEASKSLGLSDGQTMRLVIIPQALRVIVPPLTSQYLNLTKNSSLATAIGYPDLVAVFAGTVLNQSGQAVEVIAITMSVYLTLSLAISAFMNWYNERIALTTR